MTTSSAIPAARAAELRTARLVLRQWRDADRAPFAAMNADAGTMRFFPRPYSADESDRFVDANARSLAERGWGNWAVEVAESGAFAGFVGLSEPAAWHPCAGEIEIGWRLAAPHRGRGHATEAARRVLEVGFGTLGLDRIVSYTAVPNAPSVAVMRKLGMVDDGRGFDHPRIEPGSELRPHVVYRLSREHWQAGRRDADTANDTHRRPAP